jgi:hypothetical protein
MGLEAWQPVVRTAPVNGSPLRNALILRSRIVSKRCFFDFCLPIANGDGCGLAALLPVKIEVSQGRWAGENAPTPKSHGTDVPWRP